MTSCASCGHQLGVGRFCTNCGAPVESSSSVGAPAASVPTTGAPTVSVPAAGAVAGDDWHTDTAERRLSAADPRTPPSAVAPPPPPRYPLYADEVVAPSAPAVEVAPEVTWGAEATPDPAPVEDYHVYAEAEPQPDYDQGYSYEERRSPVLWILATALVLVLVAAGWWFLVRDNGSDPTASDATPSAKSGESSAPDGQDVAGRASAKAPRTAPPNEDVNGDQVSYDASNMLDGVPSTAWRAPGDGSGMTLTFTLRAPTELHQVGMINGYAKSSTDGKNRTFDWYLGNRRIESVVWVFDDGTKVKQSLEETQDLQMVDVDDVLTSKVELKILKVSKPGKGDAARDFTAVSEVSLVGDPQG